MLFQKFFRLIDFCSQVRTAPSVRMIQQHELTVVFPYLFLRQHAFTKSGQLLPRQDAVCKVVLELEDQSGFPTVHPWLEAAFVERFPQGPDLPTGFPICDQACTTLSGVNKLVPFFVG